MTQAEKLIALAERCETATGPSFLLEQEIADAVDHDPRARLPSYTASLDAAMTLVPEHGHETIWERFKVEGYSQPRVLPDHVRASAWVRGAKRCYAATPALALTAAALRARAAMIGEG